jgi:hypothetical protein
MNRPCGGIRGLAVDYWARPGLDRHQTLLLYPTLDESVSPDHPVRLLDEILRGLDWSDWTREYDGHHGQPPPKKPASPEPNNQKTDRLGLEAGVA